METTYKLLTCRILLTTLIITSLLISCTEKVEIEGNGNNCFSKRSLEDTPWVKDLVTRFTQPKSGPLVIATFLYRDNYYIAFSNPILSSPASYIFDCSGNTIGKLNINYNEFSDNAKEVELLFEGEFY